MAVALPKTVLKPSAETEEWLTSHGADFDLREIMLAEINERRSMQNQARFQALDEHLVATYAEAVAGGAQFPPIVVTKLGGGGYLIVDGNHRYAAYKLAEKITIPAYVISDASERMINILTFDANTRHGLPTTQEERKAHAVYLVDTAGVTQREAAQMLNVPAGELQYELQIIRSDRRLARLGIDRWMEIGRTTRARLEAVRSDNVAAALATLIPLAKLSAPVVNDLVTEINKQANEDDQMAIVNAAAETAKARIKTTVGGRAPLPRSLLRLQRALAYADSVNADTVDPSALDESSRKALADRLTKAIGKLQVVLTKVA